MKVLFLAPEVFKAGGVQTYMKMLIKVLKSSEDYCGNIFILNDRSNPSFVRSCNSNDALCYKYFGGSKFKYAVNLLVTCFVTTFDKIIIGHPNLAIVGLILKKCGLVSSYIVIVHGLEVWGKLNWLTRKALHNSSAIVSTTNFTAKICSDKNRIPLSKFTIIPLTCDPSEKFDSIKIKPSVVFNILFVSRQDEADLKKGFLESVDAVYTLAREGYDLSLNFIGTGNYSNKLKQYARAYENKIGKNIFSFHGRVSDSELNSAYQCCDVFLMPSQKEGFGIVFLEAMKHSKPCIGGAFGGTPEVVLNGISGVLVESLNPSEIAISIKRFMTDKSFRINCGLNARRYYLEHFHFDVFEKNWINFLN